MGIFYGACASPSQSLHTLLEAEALYGHGDQRVGLQRPSEFALGLAQRIARQVPDSSPRLDCGVHLAALAKPMRKGEAHQAAGRGEEGDAQGE